MIALVVIEAIALLVLAVLVSGLLRSHADILRALHDLGVNLDPLSPHSHGLTSSLPDPATRTTPAPAHDISGVSPDGEALRIGVVGVRRDTLLAFLTTGCLTCASFWETFAEASSVNVPGGARLVIVTHDGASESVSQVRRLAPAGLTTVMSTQAWEDYGVPVAPYFVYVAGRSGRAAGEGVARDWAQVISLVEPALADAASMAGAGGGLVGAGSPMASSDQQRALRSDRELMAAGLLPGDPRLFPRGLDDGDAG